MKLERYISHENHATFEDENKCKNIVRSSYLEKYMQSSAQTSYASMLSGTLFALHILWTFSNLFERKFKRNKLLNWKLWKCHAFKKDSAKRYRIHALYIIIILYRRWPSKTTTYLVSTFYIYCHRIYLYLHTC